MIFFKGEFCRLIGDFFPEGIRGKVGQINKIISLEAVFPYEVITTSGTETFKFLSNGPELKLLLKKEAEQEIMEYLKYVVR